MSLTVAMDRFSIDDLDVLKDLKRHQLFFLRVPLFRKYHTSVSFAMVVLILTSFLSHIGGNVLTILLYWEFWMLLPLCLAITYLFRRFVGILIILFPALGQYFNESPPLDLYKSRRILEMFRTKEWYSRFVNELADKISSKVSELLLIILITVMFVLFQVFEFSSGNYPRDSHHLIIRMIFIIAYYIIIISSISIFSAYIGFIRGLYELQRYREGLSIYGYSISGLRRAIETGERVSYSIEEMQQIIHSTLSFHDVRSRLELILDGIFSVVFPISIVIMMLAAVINYFELLKYGAFTIIGVAVTIILLGFVVSLLLAPQVSSVRLLMVLHRELLTELQRLHHASERSYAYFLRNPVEITMTATWRTLKDVEKTIETLKNLIEFEEGLNPFKTPLKSILKILIGVVLPLLTTVGKLVIDVLWGTLF